MGTELDLKFWVENKIPKKGITMVKEITENTAASKLHIMLSSDFFQ